MEISMTEHKEAHSPLEEIKNQMETAQLPEDKLKVLMEFMESKISTSSTPQFKPFWDAREKCIELFKLVENPMVRTQLWTKYSELSKEARRLKEILDEESAFNVEQIELAINALENEIADLPEALNHTEPFYLPFVHALKKNNNYYEDLQKELNYLNAYASRIHALRKELIKTEMRIKIKNKFFERLSKLGDILFPRRKELIDEVSSLFEEDVKIFIDRYFTQSTQESPFFLKDEIKNLQGIAKLLTLSTHAFKDTRLKLSESWDKLKEIEKEHKKERAEQKEIFKQNCDVLIEDLKAIQTKFESKEAHINVIETDIDSFIQKMRDTDLGRDEVKFLKEELRKIRGLIDEEANKEAIERAKQEELKEQERKEKILNFKNRIFALEAESSSIESTELKAKYDSVKSDMPHSLTRTEKQEIEKELKRLKEILAEKEEAKLLDLPADAREALSSLNEVYSQRKARRQEIKDKIDDLRKKAGTSNLDFGKAMALNQEIAEEKERLDKLNEGIKEIEAKLKALKT